MPCWWSAALAAGAQALHDRLARAHIVSDVRGRGLLLGMDLVVPGTRTLLDKKTTRWIFDTLLARGVIAMIYNPEVRINPPLIIREETALNGLAILDEALGTVVREHRLQ